MTRTEFIKLISYIPLAIIIFSFGFIVGIKIAFDNPEPISPLSTPTETYLEKCVRICKIDGSIENCFEVCLDRLTCENDIILI